MFHVLCAIRLSQPTLAYQTTRKIYSTFSFIITDIIVVIVISALNVYHMAGALECVWASVRPL